MEITIGSFRELTSSWDWTDAYKIYMLHQKKTIWNSRIVGLVVEVEKLKTSFEPYLKKTSCCQMCDLQLSCLITEKFLKTVFAYEWIIEHGWRYLKMDTKLSTHV